MPKILVLDWDENICEVKLEENEKSALSDSAKSKLSKSTRGIIDKPILLDVGETAYSATALMRSEMKSHVFDPVYAMIQESKKEGVPCPIKIVILTAAIYDESKIKVILDKFYGFCEEGTKDQEKQNENRFSTNEFSLEFYNRNHFVDLARSSIRVGTVGKKTEDDYLKENRMRLRDVYKNNHPIYLPNKAIIMTDQFLRWQTEMPGLNKQDVYLMDNAYCNTLAVKDAGFSVIDNPTTIDERAENATFTIALPTILQSLSQVVQGAKQELNMAIEAKKKASLKV